MLLSLPLTVAKEIDQPPRSAKKCKRQSNDELITVLSLTFTMGLSDQTSAQSYRYYRRQ